MNSNFFQLTGPSHVGHFIESGTNFNNRKDLLACFSCFDKGLDNW
jgi:hypothetical protein